MDQTIRSSLESCLHAFHTPGISALLLSRLLRRFGSVCGARQAPDEVLRETGVDAAMIPSLRSPPSSALSATEKALRWQSPNQHIITLLDTSYPLLLQQINAPPPVLFIRGHLDALRMPQIAIVGSRNSTPYGRAAASGLAAQLAAAGFGICSGLASGIDTAAHKAAVNADKPTLAILGNGLDSIYPESNRQLAVRIPEHGALVSEFALDSPPRADHFPQRNRIISGLSLGVIVVEAALRSGSLITARLALEQHREVFAVPGSIRSRHSRGCHRLLREGATLVETVDDILPAIESLLGYQTGQTAGAAGTLPENGDADSRHGILEDDEQVILDVLTIDPSPLDQLLAETGLNMGALLDTLMQLEIRGIVQRCAGGYVLC